MLQSIKELCGQKLGASDGEIGHVKDFYFDDRNWAVRYVVADTGTWLTGRKVLVSPHAFGSGASASKVLQARLTRKQIEGSPSIDAHKPLSRQYEEQYYKYYGLPCYWQGDGLWGMSGFPITPLPAHVPTSEKEAANSTGAAPTDAHLRSTQAVIGYHIGSSNGIAGHITDFLMDRKTWAITELVVKTGHRFSGKEVRILTNQVERICYDSSTVFVNLTREAVEQGSAHALPLVGAAD